MIWYPMCDLSINGSSYDRLYGFHISSLSDYIILSTRNFRLTELSNLVPHMEPAEDVPNWKKDNSKINLNDLYMHYIEWCQYEKKRKWQKTKLEKEKEKQAKDFQGEMVDDDPEFEILKEKFPPLYNVGSAFGTMLSDVARRVQHAKVFAYDDERVESMLQDNQLTKANI